MEKRCCGKCKKEEGEAGDNEVYPGALFELPMAEGVRVRCERCIRKSYPITVWAVCCMTHEADIKAIVAP